jgi:hypothetical protein
MQNTVVEKYDAGITAVAGAGGPLSTDQGVESLIVISLRMSSATLGIFSSLFADNSSAFLLMNSRLYEHGHQSPGHAHQYD